jgi:hypothetical protein
MASPITGSPPTEPEAPVYPPSPGLLLCEPVEHTMTFMIGNRMCAFALSMAFPILCSALPAIAAQFDGNWSMVAVTTSGHCGSIPIGLGISRGRVYSTGGGFAGHPIQLVGRISTSGRVRMNAVAGPRMAQGTGRFNSIRGSGTWAGTGPSGVCSGVWNATRS